MVRDAAWVLLETGSRRMMAKRAIPSTLAGITLTKISSFCDGSTLTFQFFSSAITSSGVASRKRPWWHAWLARSS